MRWRRLFREVSPHQHDYETVSFVSPVYTVGTVEQSTSCHYMTEISSMKVVGTKPGITSEDRKKVH